MTDKPMNDVGLLPLPPNFRAAQRAMRIGRVFADLSNALREEGLNAPVAMTFDERTMERLREIMREAQTTKVVPGFEDVPTLMSLYGIDIFERPDRP